MNEYNIVKWIMDNLLIIPIPTFSFSRILHGWIVAGL